ncbi:hypothetical protein B0H17DRAFT_1135298 [Mycena rosella]|uniref:Uncharacterized protein n=1 Tax=Mycena rosella TaxID=1033263 RepID=A0AAD7GD95_MYCRO|nr:hypothetical protein B0H17DRAFT_1135298 [Mycena rosella]
MPSTMCSAGGSVFIPAYGGLEDKVFAPLRRMELRLESFKLHCTLEQHYIYKYLPDAFAGRAESRHCRRFEKDGSRRGNDMRRYLLIDKGLGAPAQISVELATKAAVMEVDGVDGGGGGMLEAPVHRRDRTDSEVNSAGDSRRPFLAPQGGVGTFRAKSMPDQADAILGLGAEPAAYYTCQFLSRK